jgi:hypothetical protein
MADKLRVPSMPHNHHHSYVSTRPRCPVCNTDVYSSSGIHPQCAVKQGDIIFKAAEKAALTAANAAAAAAAAATAEE